MSRIKSGEDPINLEEGLPDMQLFAISMVDDYFMDIAEFLSSGVAPAHYIVAQKKNLVVKKIIRHVGNRILRSLS